MNTQILTPEQVAHQQATTDFIKTQIHLHNGKISFADYMQHALYAPQLGYYQSSGQIFGKEGDFTTAPLLSTFFATCLAEQSQEILANLENADILEFGAGTGKMAADILLALEEKKQWPNVYYILETSPTLKQRQQETIHSAGSHLLPRVKWLDRLPDTKSFRGIILANEVLDAMPVNLFVQQQDTLLEQYVTFSDNQLILKNDTPSPLLQAELDNLRTKYTFSPGYTSEICLWHKPWISALAHLLQEGVVLLIDYGYPEREYYHPDRTMGTLMCYFQHQANSDPFLYPGLQDMTAHVNFTQIAQAAVDAQLEILGYTTQAHFLLNSGIQYLQSSYSSTENFQKNQLIKQLLSPGSMGEAFKVMALGCEYHAPLVGFKEFDMRGKL